MKKKIQTMIQALMLVPLLALGASVVMPAAVTQAGCSVTGGIQEGADCARGTGQEENLFGPGGIFQTITNILLFLIGAIAVIMLIIGGIRYVISGGDQGQVTAAKNTILYAVIGIVVAFLAYAAVNFVVTQLNSA